MAGRRSAGSSGRTLPSSRNALRREHRVVLQGRLDRLAARDHEHAGHGLHDLRPRRAAGSAAAGTTRRRGSRPPASRRCCRRAGSGRRVPSDGRLPGSSTALDKTEAIRHTPKTISLSGRSAMTTYEPSTVELADDSPEALDELFEARGLGDGLPLVPPTPRARRRHARHRRRRPRRGASHAAAPRRHRDPPGRRHQRGARRVPAGDVPGRAHRDARARRARGEPAGRERDHPPGRADGARPRRDREHRRVQRRRRRVRTRATAPTRPSAGRCGWCCSTSPARDPGSGDAATHGQPAKYTFCAAENLDASPWEGYAVSRGVDAPSAVTVHCGEGPHNVHDMEKRRRSRSSSSTRSRRR